MVAFLTRYLRQLGIDRTVAVILAHRLWQAIAGLITLGFVFIFLSPIEQGYYFTFAAVAALQIILDMGLSSALVQIAAHEFAALAWMPGGGIAGPEGARDRFVALGRKALYWYSAAALVLLLLYPAGRWFIAGGAEDHLGYRWEGAWLAVVLATGANLATVPWLSIVEGTGRVAEAYLVRLLQVMIGTAAVWIVLASGGGLYAVAAMPAAAALVVLIWIALTKPVLAKSLFRAEDRESGLSWRAEVWPMQWRLGVSWLCGYFLIQMHTPLLFRTHGAVSAGQMGLTMTVGTMIGLLAVSWMTRKSPQLALYAAQRDWAALDRLFRRGFLESASAYVLGGLLALVGHIVLESTPYVQRFLPLGETAALLIALFASHLIGLFAAYLRAHRQEPFMWPSIIGTLLVVLGALSVVVQWSSTGIVAVLLLVNVGFGLPVAIWLWNRLRQEWHA